MEKGRGDAPKGLQPKATRSHISRVHNKVSRERSLPRNNSTAEPQRVLRQTERKSPLLSCWRSLSSGLEQSRYAIVGGVRGCQLSEKSEHICDYQHLRECQRRRRIRITNSTQWRVLTRTSTSISITSSAPVPEAAAACTLSTEQYHLLLCGTPQLPRSRTMRTIAGPQNRRRKQSRRRSATYETRTQK